ncbi:hypothetical protein JWG39_00935 [Desulforhopalus vacuolatus]|uniref:hypothetical protein n=1 Tax=Desulforhopalus vacuolatus TaxID=40414 RepID=UPI001966A0B5|nr:hypothetical protein [Desulforhopalus vacuolatus]MBM9518377.1 hypothetical protein [Desulforhopalus vacuolatus]
MATHTERITILAPPDFKAFLMEEAEQEGVSMSELVRQRCTRNSVSGCESSGRVLSETVRELREVDRRLVRLETMVERAHLSPDEKNPGKEE